MTPPGETYQYSYLGAGLLGHLLAQISKTTYEHLLDSLVTGLDAAGKDTPNWDFQVIVGAGGILSSVHDMSLFAKAQFDLKNEDLKLTRQTTFPDFDTGTP